MSNESRRRLTLAAGAILAGAVVPIAAAASAWADDETETFSQLVGQGLNYYEAYEVVQAENTGLPVEVSYDGNLVVDTNQIVNPLTGAVAESGPNSDIAAAIATNSPAILNQTIADATLGSNDTAFADGGGSFALAGNEVPDTSGNNDTATAIGTYSFAFAGEGNNDTATDIGNNSFADATANYDTVYDIGSGVGNGANSISAGGDDDFVFGFGNGLPNTDVVNTGVFDIVTPSSFGGAAADAAAGLPTARADDGALTPDIGLLAASSGNQYDPAVVPYSSDPTNLFAPVYTVKPIGPEEGIYTVPDPQNPGIDDTFGTQDFGIYNGFGTQADQFTAQSVEYIPTPFTQASGFAGIVSQLSQDFGYGPGYGEVILTSGGTGVVLPAEQTGFLIDEFGFGYGNVFEQSINNAGTAATIGDFVLTPYGDINISPIVESLSSYTGTLTDAAGTVDPSAFADLLSSIGL